MSLTRTVVTLVGVVLLALTARGVKAQGAQRETLLVTASCPKCSIKTSRVGALGGDGGALDEVGEFLSLTLNSSGNLFLTALGSSQVLEVTPQGRVLRKLGRGGDGPGEIRRPKSVTLAAKDSILVYDERLGRISVFESTGPFVRSFRVSPHLKTVLPLGGTSVIASARISTLDPKRRDHIAVFALHSFSGDSLTGSFGEVIKRIDPRNPYQFVRILVPYHGGLMAIRKSTHYVIEHWDKAGRTLISRLVREPRWFPESEIFSLPNPDSPASSFVVGAWIDSQDRLWVISNRAGQHWKEAFGPMVASPEGKGRLMRSVLHPELLTEGMVEVIDVQRQSLVFSSALPFSVHYVPGGGLVGAARRNEDGAVVVTLYHLDLASGNVPIAVEK
jgi:hypothetical protein